MTKDLELQIVTLKEWALKAHPKKLTLILVKYVNNFVVLHQFREVVEQAQTKWFY
jgi:hypothetical protein